MSTPLTKGLNVDDIVHIKRITSPLDCENEHPSTTHCECKITEIEGTHCSHCMLQHPGSVVSDNDARGYNYSSSSNAYINEVFRSCEKL